jgi:hypothetical protein
MRIWLPFRQGQFTDPENVPGKALPGERARRRAVEGHGGRPIRPTLPLLRPASQWRRESPPNAGPTVTLETTPRRLGKATSVGPLRGRSLAEMEVIRDQFRLYVWAAVGSYRKVRFLR